MKRTNDSTQAILKYFRELSIVVIGVFITFGLSVLIYNNNNKNDLKQYLNAVKLELEQNISDIEQGIILMQRSVDYANYLKSNDKKTLCWDTIINYEDAFYTIQTFTFKTSAFEMFKLSGIMRQMNNKELLLSIWNAYTGMDERKTLLEWGFQLKSEDLKKEVYWTNAERMKNIPMYNFYTMTPWPYEMPRLCKEMIILLKEAIEKVSTEL